MSKYIETKREFLYGQWVDVKIYTSEDVIYTFSLTKPRYSKGYSTGAMYIARERNLKKTGGNK